MTNSTDASMNNPATAETRVIYSVNRLNNEVKDLLEHSYPLIWLEAEISNLSRPASGHWYLSLKDDAAQVSCAMFRNRNQLLRFTPENGMQILVRARISLYPARGNFQLIIEHMEEAGAGALQRAYEDLKNRLQSEGLFDPASKRPLPAVPTRIGVITSATGAAIRDVLSVLRRRYPLGEVVIYPVPVQGDAAAPAVVKAIDIAQQRAECDVLLLVRGGGSLEDLWAFNEEIVARAIHACTIPIISGIGHEIDFSIADFVADQRAATPSAAAELATPDLEDWRLRSQVLSQRLGGIALRHLQQAQQKTQWLETRLQSLHPGKRLEQHMQRLDDLEQRLNRGMQSALQRQQHRLATQQQQLSVVNPARRLPELKQQSKALSFRLSQAVQKQFDRQEGRFKLAIRSLDSLSPLKTLERGYAIASIEDSVVNDAARLKSGDALSLRLAKGAVDCQVIKTHPQAPLKA